MSTKCPCCGHRSFQVVIRQMADVTFTEDDDHEVTDGPYGDLDFDDESFVICSGCGWSGRLIEADEGEKSTPLSPLQRHVADHYEGGEFAHVKTVEEAETVGDTLFTYCIYEAGDAADGDEYDQMLMRAIDQLRTVRNELKD